MKTIFDKTLSRRIFLRQALTWSKRAAALSLLPACAFRDEGREAIAKESAAMQLKGMTLEEFAKRKLHHNGEQFINPFAKEGERGFLTMLKWRFRNESEFKELYEKEKVVPVEIDWKPIKEKQGCSVTFLKHASIVIKDRGRYLVVDPVKDNIFWIKDYSPLAFDLREMPAPDYLLITHGHYDHLDMDTLKQFDKGTPLVTPLGYESQSGSLGMKKHIQLDWFQSIKNGDLEIHFLPCNHWTMRNPFIGRNTDLWGSYLIKTSNGQTIFIAGDAAYFDRYEEIGKKFEIDLAVFNLGAYEPRWFMRQAHMNPEETIKAFKELRAKRLMVVHWGTFRLGDEPVFMPPLDINKEMKKAGMSERLVHLDHGQTLFYNNRGGVEIMGKARG